MRLPAPESGDAFRMLMDGEQIVIEFGRIGAANAGADETAVLVSDRVVLPLDVGRRLLHTLAHAIKPHESGLRAAEARALSPGEAGLAARPGQAPARPPPDRSGEQAARLLRLIADWGIPHQYERSFRMSAGTLQANRFLLSVNPGDITGDAAAAVLAVGDQMGIPAAQRAAALAQFGTAKTVHFGFEGSADSIICKLYLEQQVAPADARRAHATAAPVLLHLAFKWDILRRTAVTTRYVWHPMLTADAIARRIALIYRDEAGESCAIATAFLHQAAGNAAAHDLQYLEVEEAENHRRSFDLNLYNARLALKDAQPLLQRMRVHFGLRPGQFQALYDQIRSMSLGHIAGGLHRDGRDFFNVYYGVVGLPKFNARLQQV